MKKIISQTGESYRLAALFCFAAFPLFFIPVFFEGLQHAAEVWLGMFEQNRADVFGADEQKIRLMFGALKVLSLMAVFAFVPRYFIHNQSVKKALSFSPKAKMYIATAFLGMVVLVVWVFILGPNLVSMVYTGATPTQKMLIPLVMVLILGFPMQNGMNKWVTQVFDDAPLRSGENAALNKAFKGGASPVIIVSILPMMILHYGLNIWAMGQSLGLIVVLLIADSLLVGFMGVLMGASAYVVYRYARKPGSVDGRYKFPATSLLKKTP